MFRDLWLMAHYFFFLFSKFCLEKLYLKLKYDRGNVLNYRASMKQLKNKDEC